MPGSKTEGEAMPTDAKLCSHLQKLAFLLREINEDRRADVCGRAADRIAELSRAAAQSEALKCAHEEIVLAIAFLGRDLGTDRLQVSVVSLIDRLSKADAKIRAAISPPENRCPECSALPTFLDATGTYWDGHGHFWRKATP